MSTPSWVVGVDLGGTKILARVVDPVTGRAIGRSKAPTPGDGPAAVLDAIVDVVGALDGAADAGAVGVGVPGMVLDNNVVVRCANIAGWDGPVPVGEELASRFGLPVTVANDVDCGAVAEHRLGAGAGTDDVMAVFVGTGVGAGLILDGVLRSGRRGLAGEIGHLTAGDEGRPCGCGGVDHLEAYAGRAGIERRARHLVRAGRPSLLVDHAGPGPIKSRHLARGLADADEVTVELVAQAADALALVVGNVATVLDVPRVILGGGVVDKLGQPFVEQIVSSARFGGFGSETCELRLARRLDDAGVVGAAILAADALR